MKGHRALAKSHGGHGRTLMLNMTPEAKRRMQRMVHKRLRLEARKAVARDE